MEKRRHRGIPPAGWIGFAVPLVLIAAFYILSGSEAFCNAVCIRFAYPVRNALGWFSDLIARGSYLPPSLTEIVYTVFGLAVVVFLVSTAGAGVRRRGARLITLLRRLVAAATAAAILWALFCWLWNIEYRSSSFAERSGLTVTGISVEQLTAAAEVFASIANETCSQVERDAEGHFAVPMEDCFSRSGLYNRRLLEEFPCLDGMKNYTPKAMLYSRIMSRLGYTGIYFPFTGESNINTESPACYIPFTVAHEMAHQRRVSSEAEANFVGIAACLYSENPVYVYSGSLMGLSSLMNALYKADRDVWSALYATLDERIRLDWQDNNEFWASMETQTTRAASVVYDTYLRSNGQELGIRSYGACVDLIVAWLNSN
jgi:hypothetical protein